MINNEKIIIKKAYYGHVDVKDIIEKHIKNNIIELSASNDTFGDTLPGVEKKLELEFEYCGELINYIANEGEYFIYPKPKYKKENTLILTSCNRIDEILFAIAVNKEIIKCDFNLIVVDCSTNNLTIDNAIKMHNSDDPYNLINEKNYNSNWEQIEEYVNTINKIKQFMMIHITPRLNKQKGDAILTSIGLNAAALIGSKYAVKLTGVCHLKYDIFSKFDEYIDDKSVATWKRTSFNDISTRVFICRPDKLNKILIDAGFFGWVDEFDFIERKFKKLIIDDCNLMNLDEVNIIVDDGININTSNYRQKVYDNLKNHNLLDSGDIWIQKFLNNSIY